MQFKDHEFAFTLRLLDERGEMVQQRVITANFDPEEGDFEDVLYDTHDDPEVEEASVTEAILEKFDIRVESIVRGGGRVMIINESGSVELERSVEDCFGIEGMEKTLSQLSRLAADIDTAWDEAEGVDWDEAEQLAQLVCAVLRADASLNETARILLRSIRDYAVAVTNWDCEVVSQWPERIRCAASLLTRQAFSGASEEAV